MKRNEPSPQDDLRALVDRYISDVLSGARVVGKYERLAVERHIRDLEAVDRGDRADIRFNERRAFVPLLLATRHIRHTKPRQWARKLFAFNERCAWEAFIIWSLFGWEMLNSDGQWRRRFRTAYISIARKNGKALSLDTKIPTAAGWVNMLDIEVGETVFDERGCPCHVTYVSPVRTGARCYRVEFADGSSVVADHDHEWVVRDGHNELQLTTGQMLRSYRKGNRPTHREHRYDVGISGALELPEDDGLPIDPYILGCWLGDGSNASGSITVPEAELVAHIEAAGERLRLKPSTKGGSSEEYTFARPDGRSYRGAPEIQAQSMRARLRTLGVLGDKHIPTRYLRASRAQRVALLQGLMDTDGFCSPAGQCEFTSTDLHLAETTLELIRSVGIKASMSEARAMLRGVDCGPKYRVQFFAFRDVPVFRLSRKRQRQKERPVCRPRSESRNIVGIVPVESVPVRCIEVDSPSHLYLAGDGMAPTHNTMLASILAIYMLRYDAEDGAEVYFAATKKDQAKIGWKQAADSIERSPEKEFRKLFRVVRSTSHITTGDGSLCCALGRDSDTADGLSPNLGVVDELHAHKNRDMWDVLASGMGAREEPLMLGITTAGQRAEGLCWELDRDSMRVLDGIFVDDRLFAYVARLDEGDDWADERVWPKANPNLGESVTLDSLRDACTKAKNNATHLNEFKRKQCNIWTSATTAWLPSKLWDDCADSTVSLETLAGCDVTASVDLARWHDFAASVAVGARDGMFIAVPAFWFPSDGMAERERETRVPVKYWADQGWVTTTPGDIVDQDFIIQHMLNLRERARPRNVTEIPVDPKEAWKLATDLQKLEFEVVHMNQGYWLSGAIKETEKLLREKRIRHNGSPVMRWMFGNIVASTNEQGRIKFDKKRAGDCIDGMVALVMAIGRAAVVEDKTSVYQTRGVISSVGRA